MSSTRAIAMGMAVLLAAPALAEPSVDSNARPLRISGSVLLVVGAAGLTLAGVLYLFENFIASTEPVFPPATPSHTLSFGTLCGSGGIALMGLGLLLAGVLKEDGRANDWWLTPAAAGGSAGLAFGARF